MRAVGLVAAAGLSQRMGRPKACLPFSAGRSFAARLAEVLRTGGLDPVIVTLPDTPGDTGDLWFALHDVKEALAALGAVALPNTEPALGLVGSIRTALHHAREADAIIFTPVDCPFCDAGLVEAVLAALRTAPAAVPVVEGSFGHPVGFRREVYELLCESADRGGPRAVLDALGSDVRLVPWSDPLILEDVDSPADYERLFGKQLP